MIPGLGVVVEDRKSKSSHFNLVIFDANQGPSKLLLAAFGGIRKPLFASFNC